MPKPAPAVTPLAEIIEKIRLQRKTGVKGKQRAGKQFSQSELQHQAYRGYLNLLYGRVLNPPPRDEVIQIAEYLECTPAERNAILRAAGYAEEEALIAGDSLEAGLARARQVIAYLPFPAFVATRDWGIHDWNPHLLTLYAITPEEADAVPPERRNVLDLIFDPEFPIRNRLGANDPERRHIWRTTALQNIYWFKRNNRLSEEEPWYQKVVSRLTDLPDFAELWEQVDPVAQVEIDPYPFSNSAFPGYTTQITRPNSRAIWVTGLEASLGNFNYPIVIFYLPVNAESQRMLTELDLPTPENGWGSAKITVPSSSEYPLTAQDPLAAPTPCCNPLPNDNVMGYVSPEHGFTVHGVDCPNMLNVANGAPELLTPVTWHDDHWHYEAQLRLDAKDRVGLLSDITFVAADESVNILSLSTNRYPEQAVTILMKIEVTSLPQLYHMLTRFAHIREIYTVSCNSPTLPHLPPATGH